MGDVAYPREAQRAGIERGEAVMQFTLSASGEIRDIRAVRASNPIFARNSSKIISSFKCAGQGHDVTVSVTFGETRYRALAEVSLVLLSAVAVDAALRALSRRRAQGSDHGDRLTTGRQGGGAQRDSNPNVLAESGG